MSKNVQIGFFIAVALVVLFACFTITKDGSKTVCPECGRTTIDNTMVHFVARADAGKYKVQTINELCDNCGVEVQTGSQLKCPECGNIYGGRGIETIKVKRGTEQNYSVTTTESICYTCMEKEFQDPDRVAKGFLSALQNRDIDKAVQYCDVSVDVKQSVGIFADSAFGGPTVPRNFCSRLCTKVDSNWITVGANTSSSEPFFVLGSTTENYDWVSFYSEEKNYYRDGKKIKAKGYVFYIRQISGKWLVSGAKDGGYIFDI